MCRVQRVRTPLGFSAVRACSSAPTPKTPAQVQAEFMELYREKERLALLGGGQARIDKQVGAALPVHAVHRTRRRRRLPAAACGRPCPVCLRFV